MQTVFLFLHMRIYAFTVPACLPAASPLREIHMDMYIFTTIMVV